MDFLIRRQEREDLLQISTIEKEGSYQASKWQVIPVLLSCQEMENFIFQFSDIEIYFVSDLRKKGEESVSHEEFIKVYAEYFRGLKKDPLATKSLSRIYFSSIWTVDSTCLYAVSIDEERVLIKVKKPVIQLQPHNFTYSEVDEKIRSKTFAPDAISWGIQFSYPALFQDPKTSEIEKTSDLVKFANTALFRKFQRWIRENTVPTTFMIQGKKLVTSIRTGKNCLRQGIDHLDLKKRGWEVQKYKK